MKNEKRKRAVILKTRCTDEESEMIRSNAYDHGLSVEEFLRSTSLGRRTKSAVQSQMIEELRNIAELLRRSYLVSGQVERISEFSDVLQEVKTAMLKISGGSYDLESSTKEEA